MGWRLVKDVEKNRYNIYSNNVDDYLMKRFSSIKKVLRFYKKCKKEEFKDQIKQGEQRLLSSVSTDKKSYDQIIKEVHSRWAFL